MDLDQFDVAGIGTTLFGAVAMASACGDAEGMRDCYEDTKEVLNTERLTRWKVASPRAMVIGWKMAIKMGSACWGLISAGR
ncbi:hypothetical protein BHM03_00018278 [Ensete ventricosum]|nr:hypothetical protein BHM03_00018278 [Ensete ventricosum]